MASLKHQHLIARRKGVDEGGFPGAGVGGRVDHDGVCGFEYQLKPLGHRGAELGEFGSAMIDDGAIDGPQDPVRDIGWAWNL